VRRRETIGYNIYEKKELAFCGSWSGIWHANCNRSGRPVIVGPVSLGNLFGQLGRRQLLFEVIGFVVETTP
jgi:hypothetical protein